MGWELCGPHTSGNANYGVRRDAVTVYRLWKGKKITSSCWFCYCCSCTHRTWNWAKQCYIFHTHNHHVRTLAPATSRGRRNQRQSKQARNKQSHEPLAWPYKGATRKRLHHSKSEKRSLPKATRMRENVLAALHISRPDGGRASAERNTSTKRRIRNGGAMKLSWLELALLPAPLLRQQACRKKCWHVIQLLFFLFVQGKRCVISRVTCTQACYMCI